ncbi:MAG: hypothetical protein RXP91_04940, partial [Nitrososphaeria archaeon]
GLEYAEWERHIGQLSALMEEFVRENAESALLLHLAAERLRESRRGPRLGIRARDAPMNGRGWDPASREGSIRART